MQRLDHDREVVLPGGGRICRIADVEPDPIRDAGLGSVPTGKVDGRGIEVEAVNGQARVRLRHRDRRPAGATRDVGDLRRRIGEEPGVDLRDTGQVLGPEGLQQPRPVEVALGLDRVLPVRGLRHAAARAERLLELGHDRRARDDRTGHRRHRVHGVQVGQDLGVGRRQPEPPRARPRLGIVDLQDPGGGLVLEPLAGVAFVDPGARRQVGGRHAFVPRHRPIQPEPIAEVDDERIEHPKTGVEQALGEGFPGGFDRPRALDMSCHRRPILPYGLMFWLRWKKLLGS